MVYGQVEIGKSDPSSKHSLEGSKGENYTGPHCE